MSAPTMASFQHLLKKIAEIYTFLQEDIVGSLQRHYRKSEIHLEVITAADNTCTTEKTLEALGEKYGHDTFEEICEEIIQTLDKYKTRRSCGSFSD